MKKPKGCNEHCELIQKFIYSYDDPLFAVIPDSFDEYFYLVSKDTRNCYRRAKAAGFTVSKVDQITPELHQAILEIYRSKPQRQGRPVHYLYHTLDNFSTDIREGWPRPDYRVFTCEKHYFDFYGCFLGDKLVAFLELLHSNSLATVYSTMGHADYLGKGVMKFLFLEAIKHGGVKYLQYGDTNHPSDLFFFLKDLRIVNHNADFIYSISSPDHE